MVRQLWNTVVPTSFAVWLARREPLAAAEPHDEERLRGAALKAEARREAAFQAALAASSDSIRTTFMNDRLQSAQAAINPDSPLPRVAMALNEDHEVVWLWVHQELGSLGRAVDEEGDDRLPVQACLLELRATCFSDTMTNWVLGERPDSSFETVDSPSIEDTPPLDEDHGD